MSSSGTDEQAQVRGASDELSCRRDVKLADGNSRKVALITGSSSGIGANIAFDLTKAGYNVVVTGRNLNSLDTVIQTCNQALGCSGDTRAFSCVANLLSDDDVNALINFIKRKFNRLDVLVNNVCARGESANILDASNHGTVDFSAIMKLNVSVPMNLFHKCLKFNLFPSRGCETTRRGVVINISSIASQVVVPLHYYSVSKACLSELSKQLAIMSKITNVLSVTVSPGPVLTDERPHHRAMSKHTLMNRVGETQEISHLVMFAIEHAQLFNGQELTIDGGYIAKQKQPSPGQTII